MKLKKKTIIFVAGRWYVLSKDLKPIDFFLFAWREVLLFHSPLKSTGVVA